MTYMPIAENAGRMKRDMRTKVKRVHDKSPFCDRRIEPLVDPEWDAADSADETPRYYWQEMYGGGRCIKRYKPSVAKLFSERTGLKTWLI